MAERSKKTPFSFLYGKTHEAFDKMHERFFERFGKNFGDLSYKGGENKNKL